eukprot:gene3832-4368_t
MNTREDIAALQVCPQKEPEPLSYRLVGVTNLLARNQFSGPYVSTIFDQSGNAVTDDDTCVIKTSTKSKLCSTVLVEKVRICCSICKTDASYGKKRRRLAKTDHGPWSPKSKHQVINIWLGRDENCDKCAAVISKYDIMALSGRNWVNEV